MKERTLLTSASIMPVVGLLVLTGLFSDAGPASAQAQINCPLPPGVTPLPDPSVTAQHVQDGSATLAEFTRVARDYVKSGLQTASLEQAAYQSCVSRLDDGVWRSGSIYLVVLTPDGRVLNHPKDMALSGRLLNPLIYGTILSALGVSTTDLLKLTSPDPATAAEGFQALIAELSQEPDGAFDATTPIPGLSPGIPGASGHAGVYVSLAFQTPILILGGFDIGESHLVPLSDEDIDYGNPSVSARDVVDRATLKAFVAEAWDYIVETSEKHGATYAAKQKLAFRDPNGPWRHGSVYLYILDRISNIILLHSAFPDRFEGRPLVATVRDAVTGELILPQVLAAAASNPEGGFVEYYFDDPTDDTDSADVPKVGYAREFTGELPLADGRVIPTHYVIGSGFYGRAADVGTGHSTIVEATVLGDVVEGLDVAFSRAIAGRQSDYAWSAVTDAAGLLSLTISSEDGVTGYYRARAANADGEVVGQWSSIPLNDGHRQALELTLGGGARVVRVESLAAAEPVAAAKPAFGAETVPETSGLSPNTPNPFNSATLITYHLSSTGPVKLVIYNVLGQPVRTLVDASRAAGSYQVRWDARDDGGALLSTGVYIAHMSYPGGVQTQRLLYLK